MTKGVELIAAERKRQIEIEGWTQEHDAQHDYNELAQAAVAYTTEAIARCGNWATFPHHNPGNPPNDWPWETGWWKPTDEPIRNLVKAGALIAAEIDRLLVEKQAQNPAPQTGDGATIKPHPVG